MTRQCTCTEAEQKVLDALYAFNGFPQNLEHVAKLLTGVWKVGGPSWVGIAASWIEGLAGGREGSGDLGAGGTLEERFGQVVFRLMALSDPGEGTVEQRWERFRRWIMDNYGALVARGRDA